MTSIGGDLFAQFFTQVHGHAPFPWQERLARQVVERGTWPDLLDLPTGAGKTAALDVALFALACDPQRAPRRVMLVVDRRIIVDQGADHARKLLAALHRARDGVLGRVADALRALWGGGAGERPFAVAVMRGGMPRDNAWAARPDMPVLGVSTVDQVGSRLLFRGYGVTPGMAPVHAGLLGNDTLFLLDEVHLAVPLAQTLRALAARWIRTGEVALPRRWGVVRMSATPGADASGGEPFGLDEDDRGTAELARRLAASKVAALVPVKVSGKDEAAKRAGLARKCVVEALAHLKRPRVHTVGVVVNRVDTARLVHADLSREAGEKCDVVLLTGRMRPLDRDRVLNAGLLARLRAGRERSEDDRPLILVATQCVEAGADFDLDALVTECAGLDALRQRFGRLDRLGRFDRDGRFGPARATVLVRSDQVTGKTPAPDPVYGEALWRTWAWLQERAAASADGTVDMGIAHLPLPEAGLLAGLVAEPPRAPVLLPSHLDRWVQTSHRPSADPDPALWLHGPQEQERLADVQLVWRADITEEDLNEAGKEQRAARAAEEGSRLGGLRARLAACPPASVEAMPVPVGAVRVWLARQTAVDVADVVGAPDAALPREFWGGLQAVRYRGDESEVVRPRDVRPGDTLVVPSAYGGVRFDNWAPDAPAVADGGERVPDLGDRAQWVQRGRPVLRLHAATLPSQLVAPDGVPLPRVPGPDEVDANPSRAVRDWLAALGARELPEPYGEVVRALRTRQRRVALPDRTFVLVGQRRARRSDVSTVDVSTESDDGSFVQREVTLGQHLAHVRETARRFGEHVGLSGEVLDDLVLAAGRHDLGKANPRFQAMLAGGDEVRSAIHAEPLAKSGMTLHDQAARDRARRRAGYPAGYRHELLSLALLEQCEDALAGAHDRDLVLHLVASHHGWARPFAPVVEDRDPVAVKVQVDGLVLEGSTDHGAARLDSGVPDRFWYLVRRFGWWGLAWLEALLRLADHRASEHEEQGAPEVRRAGEEVRS